MADNERHVLVGGERVIMSQEEYDRVTTTCSADEIVMGPPLLLDYACDVVVYTQADADRRKAENSAAERITAWLEEHGNDAEFLDDDGLPGGCVSASVERLAAAIRGGRWRK